MYKIDMRGGGLGGVQKSFTKTDPNLKIKFKTLSLLLQVTFNLKKASIPESQRHPLHLYSINNVVSLG